MTEQEEIKRLWEESEGSCYRALDKCGCEIGSARLKETDQGWLMHDDFEGYRRVSEDEALSFLLIEIK